MKKIAAGLCVIQLAFAEPVGAETLTAAREAPFVTASQLNAMCNPKGAFQFSFGQTGVPFSSKLENLIERRFKLPHSYTPFTSAQPSATKWSGKLYEMNYAFKSSDPEIREMTMIEVAEVIDAAGWQRLDPAEDPPMYRAGYSGDFAWEKALADEVGEPKLYLALSNMFGEVRLSCGRDDLMRVHAEEAFGKLAPGTPKPSMALIDAPATFSAADCSKPEIAAQLERFENEGRPNDYMTALFARSDYNERLTTWKMWKLEQSGKISAEALLDIGLKGVEAGSQSGNIFAHFKMLEELFPIIDRLAASQKTGNRDAMCQAFIDFNKLLGRMEAATNRQSQTTQAALDAEASRLGVSFD